jgi:hypothetical protein
VCAFVDRLEPGKQGGTDLGSVEDFDPLLQVEILDLKDCRHTRSD